MGYQYIEAIVDDGIGVVTLSRPPVNAVSQAMYREIQDAFSNIGSFAPKARVIILTGAGKHFCAGNDLAEFGELAPDNVVERMAEVREAFYAVSRCPLPTIAAVRGAAFGTGVALAASCDFVIASETATFSVPELTAGVTGGARHLARLIPESVMRWMYFTADPVPAKTLERLGGIVEVVADEELEATAKSIAVRIARHSSSGLRYAKASLNATEFMNLEDGYELEQSFTTQYCSHPNSREAINALLEKRQPLFVSSDFD